VNNRKPTGKPSKRRLGKGRLSLRNLTLTLNEDEPLVLYSVFFEKIVQDYLRASDER